MKLIFMKIYFVIVLLLYSMNNINSQSLSHIKGSFAIIAIANDGIIIAADSRGSFFDTRTQDPYTHKYKTLAYFDEMQKFFIIHDNVLVVTGTSLVGNFFINKIVDDFIKALPKQVTVDKLANEFMSYCRLNLSPEMYNQVKSNAVIAAGYLNGVPTISSFDPNGNKIISRNGFRESYQSDFRNTYSNKVKANILGKLAEKTIYKYALDNKMNYEIGGLIQIVQIKPDNSIIWLQNNFGNFKWRTIKDFLKDYFAKTIEIYFPTKEGEDFFKEQAKLLINQ